MWSLLQRKVRQTKPAHRKLASVRPRLEALEDRCLLSGAGSLDPTFGNGAGSVTTSTSNDSDIGHSVLIQPNGEIVAVGRAQISSTPSYDLAVERYNPDGSLDTSFGSGGIALTNVGSGSVTGSYSALYPTGTANAGELVQEGAVGYAGAESQILVRYNTNGTLDSTFGTGGEVKTAFPLGNSSGDNGVVVTSAGQIVALSSYGGTQFALARYNTNGSLDTTFGQGGYVITNIPSGDSSSEITLLQQPNSDLIVTAVSSSNGGTWDLYRFNANGTPDTSFGNQGIVTTTAPITGAAGGPHGVVVYPDTGTPNDGQIVVVGQASNGTVELVRYNSNGSLDATFGTGGIMQTQISFYVVNEVALDANGRIVVTGLASEGPGGAVSRFNVNGTPDTSFGNGGLVTTNVGSSSNFYGLAIYPNAGAATDGDIVVAGISNNGTKDNVLVARYLGEATSPYFQITGPSSVTAGTAGTYTISVFNPDGSADTGYSGTVHITSSDPKAVLPADFTITGDSATFSATLKTAGAQSLTATDTVTSSITGSDTSIQVTPAAASQFILSAPSIVSKGSKFSVTLTVEDAFGNVVTGYVGTIHFTSSDSSATLPKNYTFTASDAGVHTFTNAVIFRTRGKQTLSVTDTQNSALTTTDSIQVN